MNRKRSWVGHWRGGPGAATSRPTNRPVRIGPFAWLIGSLIWMSAGIALMVSQDTLELSLWEGLGTILAIVVPGVSGVLISSLLETPSGTKLRRYLTL